MRRQRFAVVVSRSVLLVGATLVGVLAATGLEAQALKDVQTPDTPLVLKAQGSFFVGGESVEQTQGELGNLGPGGHISVNQMYVRFMVPQGGAGSSKRRVVDVHRELSAFCLTCVVARLVEGLSVANEHSLCRLPDVVDFAGYASFWRRRDRRN